MRTVGTTAVLAAAASLLIFATGATGAPESGQERYWPGWRGPDGDGLSEETGLPTRFAAGETLRWRVAVPGRGHSSPVVWDDLVFLTTAHEGVEIEGHEPPEHVRGGEVYLHPDSVAGRRSHRLAALAFDASDGRLLWERTVYEGPVYDNRHRANTYASPTPLTDGELVYFHFGSQGLHALTLRGEPVWSRDLGDFGTWGLGEGISPVFFGEHLILVADDDGGEGSVIAALDRRTGDIAWRRPRDARRSWATPALVPFRERRQMVISSHNMVAGYDPATGSELWRAAGLESNAIHTPLHLPVGEDRFVFVSTGYPRKEIRALRVFADWSRPPEHVWSHHRGTGYLPSALLYRGVLYALSDGGVVSAIEPETGELIFQGRPPNPARYHASPVGYDGNVLVASLEGGLTVFRAARRFEVVDDSSLSEAIWASPAVSGGTIFVRTVDHLYAFGNSVGITDGTPVGTDVGNDVGNGDGNRFGSGESTPGKERRR